jgi:phosphoglycerate dehydrogenase-like enzyme
LESGQLSSLALDVFEHEPVDASSPLLQHQHFHGTPHIGAATIEAQRRVGLDIVDAVLSVLDGGIPETTVNRNNLG